MRFSLAIVTAAALIGAAVSAYAAEQGETEQGCDGSTYEMVQCFMAKTEQWDKRLNIAYPKALDMAQPKQREQLRKAQRAWVAFRDSNCLYWDLGEGTIARIQAGDCMYRLTKERALELEGAALGN
jgi:uncharacterized protein YecT (DUF1311 family)